MSTDQPKPASGEWTEKSVAMLYANPNHINGWKFIANAHNAALAAEREKRQMAEEGFRLAEAARVAERGELVELHSLVKINDELRKQLAAERENAVLLREQCNRFSDALAAEQKGHEMDGQLISSQESEIVQLREQLAAERQKNWIRAEDNPGFHRHE